MRILFRCVVIAILLGLTGSTGNLWGTENYDVKRRYIELPDNVADTSVSFSVDTAAVKWIFEARAALEGRRRNTVWGLGWTTDDGRTCNIELMHAAKDYSMNDEIVTDPSLRIVATLDDRSLYDRVISKGMAAISGYNTLSVEVAKGAITVYGGSELLEHIATLPEGICGHIASVRECHFLTRGNVKMDYAVVEECYPAWRKVATSWTRDCLEHYAAEVQDSHEGYWRYLDREMDPAVSRLGGKYQVILVSNAEDGYDIIYYTGAETGADQWRCGMLKGVLTPSPFAGQYELKWYDTQFRCHTDEAYATFSEGNRLLTLSLPLLRATLRFARP